MKFTDLDITLKDKTTKVGVPELGVELTVRQYLPIDEKAGLLQFIVANAIDNMTGCFSPLRLEVYFAISVCRWYAGITFDDVSLEETGIVYDKLEQSGIIDLVMAAIPDEELEFLQDLVNDTAADIARYNNSFAGMIKYASDNSKGLNSQITDVLEKIKNSEGMEQLEVFRGALG